MRFQDSIIEATRYAASEAFKFAKAVPADKLNWKPLDAGRSVIELCRELAMCATWSEQILKGENAFEWSEESQAASQKEQESWITAEACEVECMKRLEAFFAVVKDFPDEKMGDKFTLPFDGGQVITMRENMLYPQWNFTYHQGQIAYIQTLYGDAKMYW